MKSIITIDRDGGDAMKKKISLLAIMSVSIMLLSACSSTKTLKDENNAIVAQYIAGSVLKFDKYYSGGLVYPYQRPSSDKNVKADPVLASVNKKEDIIKNDKVIKNDNSSKQEDTRETYSELSDIYQNKNLTVDLKKFTTTTSYSGDYSEQAFNVEAKSGNQLVILEFNIKNNSKKKQTVNLVRSGISYELKIGDEVYYPILSIVSNDIQYFSSTIAAGKSKNAVLLFEVPQKTKISNTTLTVTNIDNVSQVTVK
mgnify:CR=1 FL=1